MEEKESIIIYGPKTKKSISQIATYIEECGYPESAENFVEKLYDFGNSLNIFPVKYPICRFPKLGKRNLRCAVFHKNYIFVYKTVHHQLIIYNVIHTKTLK